MWGGGGKVFTPFFELTFWLDEISMSVSLSGSRLHPPTHKVSYCETYKLPWIFFSVWLNFVVGQYIPTHTKKKTRQFVSFEVRHASQSWETKIIHSVCTYKTFPPKFQNLQTAEKNLKKKNSSVNSNCQTANCHDFEKNVWGGGGGKWNPEMIK